MARPVPLPQARRADALGRREQTLIYGILALASLAYNYNFVVVDFIRPFLIKRAGMTLAETAWLYTAQGSGVILGSFLVPVIVARFHAKPVLVTGALALAALTATNLAAESFAAWAASRFLVGIGLTATYIASITMLANLFPPRVRARLLGVNMAMFSIALMGIGALGSAVGEGGWRTLLWVGVAGPLVVAVLVAAFLPSDRGLVVYADEEVASEVSEQRGSWREMLSGRRLWLTLACLVLAGLNFSAYQFYSGFITTYLTQVRHFSAELTGLFVTIDGIGTLLGTLLWGWIADRYGRRVNAAGFALAAVFAIVFLVAPVSIPVLMLVELGYAICLSCTNVWAAYFAELFPVRLRPMGTSLFHGGHVISIAAPLIVAGVAAHFSLTIGMALAPLTFLAGAILWAALPETLKTSGLYRGFSAERAGR
ncbi:nitrate/nitrite transporter [Novosphingobium sp. Gsoil 351]|uniref:MFS transporter n=1 Tax=Novosphingobium sp. Gsoil 351 TaxID=2675225 RepID=UPI0018A804D7|nr:MFS transporter [Novosphingobium sp. Gsoil 351]